MEFIEIIYISNEVISPSNYETCCSVSVSLLGGEWVSRAGGRHFNRSVRCDSAVAFGGGSVPHADPQTPGGAAAGAEHGAAPCPVGLHTLAFPSLERSSSPDHQPWVYLTCGHVPDTTAGGAGAAKALLRRTGPRAERSWGWSRASASARCAAPGACYVPLKLGRESAFYLDAAPPTYAFSPCGHVCSEHTAAFWSTAAASRAHGLCPRLPLLHASARPPRKSVRLIFHRWTECVAASPITNYTLKG